MLNLSLKQLSQNLNDKTFSSRELTEFFLSRIKKYNKQLNAFITIDESSSLSMAKMADDKISKGEHKPLTGIPIAQKDIFCAEGWRTTCGSKMLENFIAPYNATVIQNFNDIDAVNLGKTNMDEFAMGSSNETSYFGSVKNPWNLDCVPGGSSGGSASAVAARLAPAATGTDTGGSIRQPASLCGFTGLKPTYGLVSRYGMIAFASSLDQAGPMAPSAEDCAMLLNSMASHDHKDSTSIDHKKEDYTTNLNHPIQGLKIGIPKEFFGDGLNASVQKIIEEALDKYKKLGAELIDISLPNSDLAIPVYYVIAPAEASSNLSRYDGVRYGYRTKEYDDLMDMYFKTRQEGFGEEVKRRILIGTYVLSAGYYDAYYLKAQKCRQLVANDFREAFKLVDLILSPTTPDISFQIGEKMNDPVEMYLQDIFTIPANLAGLPAISVPCGSYDNLPLGIQLISNALEESKLLRAAHYFQLNTDWHKTWPEVEK